MAVKANVVVIQPISVDPQAKQLAAGPCRVRIYCSNAVCLGESSVTHIEGGKPGFVHNQGWAEFVLDSGDKLYGVHFTAAAESTIEVYVLRTGV